MLTLHHLQRSQSERIVWLLEELGIEYELKTYKRQPDYRAPPIFAELHPQGSAPIIQDGAVTLAESNAVVEYILAKYGNGKLSVGADANNFADYLFWFAWANGYFQPVIMNVLTINRIDANSTAPGLAFARANIKKAYAMLDTRCAESTWLAGEEFTAADIMVVWSVTTMRLYSQADLSPYPGILGWLKRVGQRPAYRSAMAKGDPGLEPILGAEKPPPLRL